MCATRVRDACYRRVMLTFDSATPSLRISPCVLDDRDRRPPRFATHHGPPRSMTSPAIPCPIMPKPSQLRNCADYAPVLASYERQGAPGSARDDPAVPRAVATSLHSAHSAMLFSDALTLWPSLHPSSSTACLSLPAEVPSNTDLQYSPQSAVRANTSSLIRPLIATDHDRVPHRSGELNRPLPRPPVRNPTLQQHSSRAGPRMQAAADRGGACRHRRRPKVHLSAANRQAPRSMRHHPPSTHGPMQQAPSTRPVPVLWNRPHYSDLNALDSAMVAWLLPSSTEIMRSTSPPPLLPIDDAPRYCQSIDGLAS